MTAEFLNQAVGKVNYVPNEAKFLGVDGLVEDRDFSSGVLLPKLTSGHLIGVMQVRATGTIVPGARVKWTTTDVGLGVETAGAGEGGVGIADPNLTANLAANDTFLMFYKGPVKMIDSGAGIAEGARVEAAASGEAATFSSGIVIGRAMEAAAADASFRCMVDFSPYGTE